MHPFRTISVVLALFLLMPAGASAQRGGTGAVYAMTNGADGNAIVVWNRDAQGRLTLAGSFDTGGRGSGGGLDPLASQDALRLSDDHRWLFAVNAGSDDVSIFRVTAGGLELTDRVPSRTGSKVPSPAIFSLMKWVTGQVRCQVTGKKPTRKRT